MNVSFFVGVISIMVVFLYGCIGEIITEKSGHLNLGTPGVMCFGATGAIVGARIFINICGGPDIVRDGGGSPERQGDPRAPHEVQRIQKFNLISVAKVEKSKRPQTGWGYDEKANRRWMAQAEKHLPEFLRQRSADGWRDRHRVPGGRSRLPPVRDAAAGGECAAVHIRPCRDHCGDRQHGVRLYGHTRDAEAQRVRKDTGIPPKVFRRSGFEGDTPSCGCGADVEPQ